MANTTFFPLKLRTVALALWAVQVHASGQAQVQAQVQSQVAEAPRAVTPIAALDVPRYMGAWFEVAKYPNRFQRQCVRNTTAEYALQGDGTVRVTNRCVTAQGDTIEAVGQARQVGAATSPKLEVRFAPAWLSFLPFVWGNYWVIDLDERYQLVAVSEPTREYLWVLSRTPQVDPSAYQGLLGRLSKMGFDVSKLDVTKQH